MTPAGVRPDVARPGQESVWDYPRPPRVEPTGAHVVVRLGGVVVAETDRRHPALRVLETSHPPTFYLPVAAFRPGSLEAGEGSSWCEFKGTAAYLDLIGGVAGDVRAAGAAWTYPRPSRGFEALTDHVALYPGRVDEVTVDGERVRPQAGGFYGGWITDRVVGPFKGGPGTSGW